MAALNLVGYCSGELAALIALDAKNGVFLRHLACIDDFNAQRPRLGLRNIRRLHVSDHVFEFERFTWTSFLRRAEIGFRRFGDFDANRWRFYSASFQRFQWDLAERFIGCKYF
jgi:hypothetical protein